MLLWQALSEQLHRLDTKPELGEPEPPGSPGIDVEAIVREKDRRLEALQNELDVVTDQSEEFQRLLEERNLQISELDFEIEALKARPVVVEAPKETTRVKKVRDRSAEHLELKQEMSKLREANKLLQARLLEAAEDAARRPAEPQNDIQRRLVEEATSQMEAKQPHSSMPRTTCHSSQPRPSEHT